MKSTEFFPADFLTKKIQPIYAKANNDWPRLSIVMPSFNQEKYIERSILSVLNQNYPNLQFIIIDGGSTDGTVETIKKYADKIDYWVSEKDAGQSDALNKGFAHADGDIYGWMNSDDLYLPNAFQSAVTAFQENKEKMVVYGDWLSINEHDAPIDLCHAFDFNLNHFKYEGFHLNAQSMFWRSDVHKEFSGFDVDLYNTMDYQMILEFGINIGQEKFFRIPQVFGAFRRYEGQKTSGLSARVLNEHQKMAQRYGYSDKYGKLGKLRRLPFRFRRAYWYLKRGGIVGLGNRLRFAYAHAN